MLLSFVITLKDIVYGDYRFRIVTILTRDICRGQKLSVQECLSVLLQVAAVSGALSQLPLLKDVPSLWASSFSSMSRSTSSRLRIPVASVAAGG